VCAGGTLSAIILTIKGALDKFLSTSSGTQFVTRRAYQMQVGVTVEARADSTRSATVIARD
jgi:hypothetical protein